MKQVVHAACPHDCPDACGVLITVQDGRATKIQGDPEHPVTRGFLCAKVAKYLDRVYSPDRWFFHRLGASQLDRTICSAAGEAGLKSVLGVKMGTEPEQFRHSKYIIAWASNIHGNNVHLWPFIMEARRNGAKLVVIDPYRTRTAECADWYLPINPG